MAESHFRRPPNIAVEGDRIARPRMAAGQQFAANLSVLRQALALQILYRDRRFMVIQLANQILAIVIVVQPRSRSERNCIARWPWQPGGPGVAAPHLSQVRGICRPRLLLDLQEKRVVLPLPSR